MSAILARYFLISPHVLYLLGMNIKQIISVIFGAGLLSFAPFSFAQDSAQSLVDSLNSLAGFHANGVLTDEEFNAAKRRLLGLSAPDGSESVEDSDSNVSAEAQNEETDSSQLPAGYTLDEPQRERRDFENGDYFIGIFEGDMLVFGYGKVTYENGTTYIGDVKDGKRHGRGVLESKTGTYEGNWYQNVRSGQGMYFWADGTSYEGSWRNDKQDGTGLFRFPDGTRQRGRFRDGEWVPDSPPVRQQNTEDRRSRKIDWGGVSDVLNEIGRCGIGGCGSQDSRSSPHLTGETSEPIPGVKRCRYSDGSSLVRPVGGPCPQTN